MFTESARLYDAIYATFKDYAAEASRLAVLIRTVHPSARTVLDVACGTGEHAKLLRRDHGFEVDGLDLDGALLDVAREKVPDARFYEADMSAFDLGRRYDVVMCLFSSIGYLKTTDRVADALRCFARHVVPGGVIVVEPWFAPGVLKDGTTSTRCATADGIKVERSGRITIEGRLSTTQFDYRIEEATGVREAHEVHELGLFTPDETRECFEAAGLAVDYDPVGLTGRGLYIAR